MKAFRRFRLARAIAGAALGFVLVTASGGGDDSAAPAPAAPFADVLGYELPQSPVYPAGTITISPSNGHMTILRAAQFALSSNSQAFPCSAWTGLTFSPRTIRS